MISFFQAWLLNFKLTQIPKSLMLCSRKEAVLKAKKCIFLEKNTSIMEIIILEVLAKVFSKGEEC